MPMTTMSAPFDNQSVTLATDIFHGTVASNRMVTLTGMTLGNFSDLGDAAEEVLRIGLYRTVTGGSGGSALTEVAYDAPTGPSPSLAVLANNTTPSTSGTLLEVISWNIRVPLMWIPIPEMRPMFAPDHTNFAFRLMAAPTDAISVSGTLFWQSL